MELLIKPFDKEVEAIYTAAAINSSESTHEWDNVFEDRRGGSRYSLPRV
jgi:hypothetical protein